MANQGLAFWGQRKGDKGLNNTGNLDNIIRLVMD